MLKILQVCPKYDPSLGGVEEHVKNLSEKLAQRFDVVVATTDPTGKLPTEETISHVQVKRFRSWNPQESYYFSRQLKNYLADVSDDFDVVHAHSYHAFPALYAAQTKNRNKLVFTPHYHGTGHTAFRSLLHKPYKWLGKKIFDKADRLIAVSQYEKNLIMKNFKVAQNKITVIPNGIDTEELGGFKKTEKPGRTILSVGRLEQYKGMQHLILVLPLLPEDISLEIVGKGPYKQKLDHLVHQHEGLSNRITFSQELTNQQLLQKYIDADLFALLSQHEAYGITVATALAAGVPCIVANTSGLKEWTEYRKNCWGIDIPIDLNRLASLIQDVIGKHVDKVKFPSWDDVANETAQVYLS